jgi:hypothetical protein
MYYKEAVKLKPSFADAYLNQGNVYKALECLKMPLCVINVHCRHALTMLWLMILISGEMRTSLQENGPFFTFKVEP